MMLISGLCFDTCEQRNRRVSFAADTTADPVRSAITVTKSFIAAFGQCIGMVVGKIPSIRRWMVYICPWVKPTNQRPSRRLQMIRAQHVSPLEIEAPWNR